MENMDIKLKEGISFEELEKYGFEEDCTNCEPGDTYYHANNYNYESTNGEFRITINMHSRMISVLCLPKEPGLCTMMDLKPLYDLISNNMVEEYYKKDKISNKGIEEKERYFLVIDKSTNKPIEFCISQGIFKYLTDSSVLFYEINEENYNKNDLLGLSNIEFYNWVKYSKEYKFVVSSEEPYMMSSDGKIYNPKYGDDRICECGHLYYRHFDSYENMEAVGCKYCSCHEFKEKKHDLFFELFKAKVENAWKGIAINLSIMKIEGKFNLFGLNKEYLSIRKNELKIYVRSMKDGTECLVAMSYKHESTAYFDCKINYISDENLKNMGILPSENMICKKCGEFTTTICKNEESNNYGLCPDCRTPEATASIGDTNLGLF